VSVSERQRENATKVTYKADPAAFIEGAAHAAYFTEAMRVMRERLKRSNSSTTEACRRSIFCGL
jgi:hypothetical protein